MLRRIGRTITFYLERFILGGTRNQLLFMAGVIVIISLLGGSVLYLISRGDLSLPEAVWWAFLRLSDPGYLGDDEGLARRFISTAITVLGYVVFLGSLIAIMTQWLNATMRKLEMGLTTINQRGHVLILGWTNRTPIIVREILYSGERATPFLRLIRKSRLRIVILAENVTQAMVQELRDVLGPLWNQRQIILRSGTPLRMDHLERVDFIHAGVVIIPAATFAYGGAENIDTRTIKVLLSISREAHSIREEPPFIVTEILDLQKVSALRSLYLGHLEIVASNLMLNRLLVQNVRHRGLSQVYSELLSNRGNEIYIREAGKLAGEQMMSLPGFFPKAVLMGILQERGGGYSIVLPGQGGSLREDDSIVLIAEEFGDTEPVDVAHDDRARDAVPPLFPASSPLKKKHILLIGWNYKVPTLLAEFDSYRNEHFYIDVFCSMPVDERMYHIHKYGITLKRIRLRNHKGNPVYAADYSALDLSSYDSIILLADDRLSSGEESDARTIMAMTLLEDMLSAASAWPQVIIELNDPDNENLVKTGRDEVLVSPLIISYSLTQIALKRLIKAVYDELFTSEGAEILFRGAGYYDIAGKELSFREIERSVRIRGDAVIGLRLEGQRVELNPSKEMYYSLSTRDMLVVISTGE